MLVLFFAICIYPRLSFAQTACCDNPACRDSASRLLKALGQSTDFLGQYFTANHPTSKNEKKEYLDSLKTAQPSNYNAIKEATRQIIDWQSVNLNRKKCIGAPGE